MSKFTDALSAFISAEQGEKAVQERRVWNSREEAQRAWEIAERDLAQAGEVLESALRQMMREEVSAGVRARYEAEIPPPRYGMEDFQG